MNVLKRETALVAMALALLNAAPSNPAFAAEAERAGDVSVTQPTSDAALTRGGSATPFTMRLPDNATCPGDSADDDFRVDSFLVPRATDISTMRFKSQGPQVPGGWAIYKTTTSPFISEFTDDAEKKGDPGSILPLPPLSFGVFTSGELAPGEYVMGVSCSLFGEVKRYWSTDIALVADATDKPAGIRWVQRGIESSGSGSPFMFFAGSGLVALAALAIAIGVRRSGPAAKQNRSRVTAR